jgi:hypothetical protein
MSDFFLGRKALLATKHKKEKVIAPILEKEFGVKVVVPLDFDTDNFGTFTRDIKRKANQVDTARKKALSVLEKYGGDLAIASEGSFAPDPEQPFLQCNLELVLIIDRKNNLEIKGYHRSSGFFASGRYVSNVKEAMAFAESCGFPGHGVVIRLGENKKNLILKDIESKTDLSKAVEKMLARPFVHRIFIETDMRAHRNPTRMQNIAKATEDLVRNIRSLCPVCSRPGFVPTDSVSGLLCEICQQPTSAPFEMIFTCGGCGHSEKRPINQGKKFADPGFCDYCNP